MADRMDILEMSAGEMEAVISLYIHRELADGVSGYHIVDRIRGMVSNAVDVQTAAEYRATDIEIAQQNSEGTD